MGERVYFSRRGKMSEDHEKDEERCPECGSRLMKESDCRPKIEGIGSFFSLHTSRHFDEWSMISRKCINFKCNYVR